MKTTTDIAAFLKRTGAVLTLSYDGGKFLAHVKGDECASKYLDDALENLAESMRRKANGMDTVRETKPAPAPITSTIAGQYIPPFSNLPSISQAAQQAYQPTTTMCSRCAGSKKIMISNIFGSVVIACPDCAP